MCILLREGNRDSFRILQDLKIEDTYEKSCVLAALIIYDGQWYIMGRSIVLF